MLTRQQLQWKIKTMKGQSLRLPSCNMLWQLLSLTSKIKKNKCHKRTLVEIFLITNQTQVENNRHLKCSNPLIKVRSSVQKKITSILKKPMIMLWSKRVVCRALNPWILPTKTSLRARQMFIILLPTLPRKFSLAQTWAYSAYLHSLN